METKHTPTPWQLPEGPGITIYSKLTGEAICSPYRRCTNAQDAAEVAEANAAFIVRAVNAHEYLVAALIEIKKAMKRGDFGTLAYLPLVNDALTEAGAA